MDEPTLIERGQARAKRTGVLQAIHRFPDDHGFVLVPFWMDAADGVLVARIWPDGKVDYIIPEEAIS